MKQKQAKKIVEELKKASKIDTEFFDRLNAFHQLQQEKETDVWTAEFVDRLMKENTPQKDKSKSNE